MSVVDQQVRFAGGLVGRLVLRVLLVLGGAFAVTVLGWCLNCACASADVLPQPVPSLPQVISPQVINVVAPQLSTSELPAAPSLPCACLDGVTKQVHTTVDGVGDRVAPVARVVSVPSVDAGPVVARVVHIVVPQAIRPAFRRPVSTVRAPLPVSGAPAPPVHHSPVWPPAQPVGSADFGAHGSGGVSGGTGAAVASFVHVIGAGPTMVGLPAVPFPAASAGQQPGTSPD